MNTLSKFVGWLRCQFGRHDWQKRPVSSITNTHTVVGECSRCDSEAKVYEAMGLGGRGVPGHLLEQDDVDKMKAKYRDGELSDEQFEMFVGAAMGDEESIERVRAQMEQEKDEC